MLKAHPTVLRKLVARYESLSAGAAGSDGTDPRIEQQLQDTAYTLCVSTGTREVGAALAAARARIEDEDAAAA
ncbi:DUF5133 domain-containing protein [Actinacidiphila bryophytorum]|uniref:DUF5133 domain-containing protein n=1 Tax=Actinacidiphila bryophytorum TaxID=1436133 RepID=UPI002176AA4E|nr:DUF5133 domain-containing protein [Actinacidiphila bryophytorum]UWE09559.1 DUF5133 domain-containing protein [Actinacidiphila bryophytorum]